jgi:hypothetical protein
LPAALQLMDLAGGEFKTIRRAQIGIAGVSAAERTGGVFKFSQGFNLCLLGEKIQNPKLKIQSYSWNLCFEFCASASSGLCHPERILVKIVAASETAFSMGAGVTLTKFPSE